MHQEINKTRFRAPIVASNLITICIFPQTANQDKGSPVRALNYPSILPTLITTPNYLSNNGIYNEISPQFSSSLNNKPGEAAKQTLMHSCGGAMHQS